jgi:ABC-2 type transport system ATP-binding protein
LESVLRFEGVSKVFRSSLAGRHLYTLGPVDFEVQRGEIFGYLGPNGAGKTTTIRLAMGLLKQTTGKVVCFGKSSDSLEARSRIGFLPEQPYFYQHLTAFELLEFCGEMFGLHRPQIRCRAEALLRTVRLEEHRNTRLSHFSKGMLQRIGLAQALMNNPDMVILDEPLSGLDPVGRRELRDLIVNLKADGKTVFFSSHILQDVEMICDRVAILALGRILRVAAVEDVLYGSIATVEVLLEDTSVAKVRQLGLECVSSRGGKTVAMLPANTDVNQVLHQLMGEGARVVAVTPLRQTLEDYFVSEVDNGRPEPQRRRRWEPPDRPAERRPHEASWSG